MEKIKLTEILTAILEFEKDPTEENDEKVRGYMQKLQVIPYLSMNRKMICAAIITSNIFNVKRDAAESAEHLTVAETMYGMLEYCVNLENDLESYIVDETIYDALYEFGFMDYIFKYCGTDFKRLCDLVDKMINFTNIYKIVETADYFKSDNIDALTKEIEAARKELTPEMLENMKSIINGQSPEWKAWKESVGDDVLGRVLDKDIDYITRKSTPRKETEEDEDEDEEGKKEKEQKA